MVALSFTIGSVGKNTKAIRQILEDVSLGSPDNAIGFVLWRIVSRYQREMDRALAPIDLTNLQFVTLALAAWFEQAGQPASQAELARFGGIHPMQISYMLKTLESKGFIMRERSASDTRAKCVSLTRTGLGTLRLALPRAVEVQGRLFGEEGRPGGGLLAILLALDRKLDAPPEE